MHMSIVCMLVRKLEDKLCSKYDFGGAFRCALKEYLFMLIDWQVTSSLFQMTCMNIHIYVWFMYNYYTLILHMPRHYLALVFYQPQSWIQLLPLWRFSLLAQRSCSSLVSWPVGSGSVGNLRISEKSSLNQYKEKKQPHSPWFGVIWPYKNSIVYA